MLQKPLTNSYLLCWYFSLIALGVVTLSLFFNYGRFVSKQSFNKRALGYEKISIDAVYDFDLAKLASQ